MITKWEYMSQLYLEAAKLNVLGEQGWELVCSVGKDGNYLLFKRPVQQAAAKEEKKGKDYSNFI